MDNIGESLLDLFIFETSQNIEQLESIILDNEEASEFSSEAINEIFRIMHTIKGSAAMMMFDNISTVAHRVEDLFYFIRERSSQQIDYSGVPDLVLESLDFTRNELDKIKEGAEPDGDCSDIVERIMKYLAEKKEKYEAQIEINAGEIPKIEDSPYESEKGVEKESAQQLEEDCNNNTYIARVFFEDGCQMESLRAFDITNKLSTYSEVLKYHPEDIMENDNSAFVIREIGFEVVFKTNRSYQEINDFFSAILFLKTYDLKQYIAKSHEENFTEKSDLIDKKTETKTQDKKADKNQQPAAQVMENHNAPAATIINVNVAKLDKLMDLVGEMVISESMVVENPDLKDMELENFRKAARQLHKITTELQDTVMSIRMVPLADVFQKMHRIVRDMGKKLDKEVKLEIIGEETQADKNIITHLSDPLMHLVRNCIDHGIEETDERLKNNKSKAGKVTLEARNAGNDVLVIVRDDGSGLDKGKILEKAKKNGLLKKDPADMSDSEIYNLIFIPGFSTNDNITEYSGRGVGMDVVTRNIEEVGGSVSVDSQEGIGTSITIKIPLTLAIIDGMNVRVGNSCYTIPIISIKESFCPKANDLIIDPDGNEMIMVRGQCYAVIRLHKCFNVKTEITDLTQGIFIMVEQYGKTVCLFADELIGQQQVVVKTLPSYIKKTYKIYGLAGCTLLGDGSISLILDIGWFIGNKN